MTPKIFFYLDNHFDGRKRYIEESLFLMKDKLELKRFKPRKCSSHHSEQLDLITLSKVMDPRNILYLDRHLA